MSQLVSGLSVVMPTYNGASFLVQSLESLRAQTRPVLEVIAIDDGSTDDTVAILEEYSERLPLTLLSRCRRGWVANTNEGIEAARGRYLSILHQDDTWHPRRVELLERAADRWSAPALIFHPVQFVDSRSRVVGRLTAPQASREQLIEPQTMLERLIVQNFIAVPSVALRRELLPSARPMSERLWYSADWRLWLQVAGRWGALYLPETLASFRLHGASLTVKGAAGEDDFRSQLEAVQKEWIRPGHGFSDSVVRAARYSVEVNVGLAAAAGSPTAALRLAVQGFALGWKALREFVVCSRIHQRALARVRAGVFRITFASSRD